MTVAPDDLRRVPLFQGMTDRALDALAELAADAVFDEGHVITREGQDGDAFYLVLEGSATVTRGGRLLRELGPANSSERSPWWTASRAARP